MLNNDKKGIIVWILCACLWLPAMAETAPAKAITTGGLLLIQSTDPYEVYSGGALLGTAPLLLSDLPPGKLALEFRLGSVSIAQEFQVSPFVEGVTAWQLEAPAIADAWDAPPPAALKARAYAAGTATLDVSRLPAAAVLRLDGATVEIPRGAKTVQVPAGLHLYRLELPGRLPLETVIALEAGATASAPSAYAPAVPSQAQLPRYLSTKDKNLSRAAGWSVITAGAGLSVASLIINNDKVSVGMSGGNYEQYSMIKYASLAGFGLGLTATGLGLGILGGAR